MLRYCDQQYLNWIGFCFIGLRLHSYFLFKDMVHTLHMETEYLQANKNITSNQLELF